MACFLALIIFSILGIFSATHRALAREAFQCVFRKITLRPCNTDFKEKIKSRLVGKVLGRSVFLAKILNRHFELFSWAFSILMIASTIWVIQGGYNFYAYGSCNGLNQEGFCAFDPTGENNKISGVGENGAACSAVRPSEKNLTLKDVRLDLFSTQKKPDAKNTVVFIGCYACDYTRKAYPIMQKLLTEYPSDFTFLHFPTKSGTAPLSELGICAYEQDPEKFWKLNDALFASPKEALYDPVRLKALAAGVSLDAKAIEACMNRDATKELAKKQRAEIEKTKAYGTPTIFINGQALVGPKPTRVFERLLSD